MDRDSIDGFDELDLEELNEQLKPREPWLDFSDLWKDFKIKEYKCTCGSEKTYGKGATHSEWCDSLR